MPHEKKRLSLQQHLLTMKKAILFAAITLLAAGCKKPMTYGRLDVETDYSINQQALITDSLCFVNEAENHFLINEIQWFVSRIELHSVNGDWVEYAQDAHYIDTDIPESQTLRGKSIPDGHYTSLRFTFGLDETDNQTGIFSDPPESNMFWPENLGGGYHYMKLNGKYVGSDNQLKPLAVHLGIGQNDDCSQFYQNYFTVELPIDFDVLENAKNQLDLTMVIDNWFRNPNLYDFNKFGSAIMQNQTAQRLLSGNGKDVFRIGKPAENKSITTLKKENTLAVKLRNVMQMAAPEPHFWAWENVAERFRNLKFQDFMM